MSTSFKEMIVVLVIATVIFRFAKPIALRFSAEADFLRRRNVWFALTATAFLSPNFWLFALVAIPLLAWAGRKDSNPVAFYLLLLHVIPSIPVDIPVVWIKALFPLDNYRLLSFCVLIPAAWRLRRSKDVVRIRGLEAMDMLLLAYGVLEVALFVRPDLPGHVLLDDSVTNMLRRTFLFYVDVYVLYFVVSRSCSNRRVIIEAQAAFCLGCALMAALAIFESVKHWLLYADFSAGWNNDPALGFYLFRGAFIRAQASAGHPLALGYLLAVALGFWLYLKSHVTAARVRIAGVLLFWFGLIAAYSRGPWVGAAAIYFAFAALRPRAFPKLFKAAGVAAVLAGAISLTPLGTRIGNVLPFMGGSVDSGSLDYRERLIQRSWQLIQQNPFFGDQFALSKMEDLRQGQGIVDVVNTYVGVALNKGLVGLFIFVAFILMALVKTYRAAKATVRSDLDLALLGFSLVACILGTLVMIENCSFIFGYEKMFYVLAGLSAAFAHLSPSRPVPVYASSASWNPRHLS
jgi:O-antigen ligase